jgi:hypothetical protein
LEIFLFHVTDASAHDNFSLNWCSRLALYNRTLFSQTPNLRNALWLDGEGLDEKASLAGGES